MKKLLSFSTAILLFVFMLSITSCEKDELEDIAPEIQEKAYNSGSCNSGSFSVSYNNANFVTGLGWSTGSGRTISFSGSASGQSWGPGVYGWMTNPLIEYYIGKSGGANRGSYTVDGRSYTLYVDRRYGQPSIQGTADFDQYNCSGSRNSPVNMGGHINGWRARGASVGNHNYQVVMVEGWSNNTGSANVSVSGANWYTHWVGSGSATFTCGGSSGGGGNNGGGNNGGGSQKNFTLRARSTDGQGQVNLRIGSQTIATFTLSSGMSNYTASTYNSGDINVQFYNDASGRDVQIDYLSVNGSTRQAENQSYNTGVYQNGSCGGSNSEWMHCNGVMGFGNTP